MGIVYLQSLCRKNYHLLRDFTIQISNIHDHDSISS